MESAKAPRFPWNQIPAGGQRRPCSDRLGESNYDGVFAMWYGKGPGVDRCGDVFKHMNHAGTSRQGGVLLVAADDLGAHSSTLPHQSEHAFASAMIPVLYPANMAVIAERAFTSRATLQRVEAGDPSVSIGIYAAVLQALGLLDGIQEIADAARDTVGLA